MRSDLTAQSLPKRKHMSNIAEEGRSFDCESIPKEEELISEIYENELPSFVESALERLYSSIYCTLVRLTLYDDLVGVKVYVAIAGAEVRTVILFRRLKETVYVLNQQIALSERHIYDFATKVFNTFQGVKLIKFYALDTAIKPLTFSYPFQQVSKLEENIILLPRNEDEFIAKLSTGMRKAILNSIKLAKSNEPTYQFEILSGGDIPLEFVHAIIMLAEKRMRSKNLPPYIEHEETKKLITLAHRYGRVGIIKINGEICAGHLWFKVGKRYFSHLMGHDPKFNIYALGNQVQFLAILHCISEGGEEYRMMGGSGAHKARFLTREIKLNSITVYKSKLDMALSWRTYAKIWVEQKYIIFKKNIKTKVAQRGRIGTAISIALNIRRKILLSSRNNIHLRTVLKRPSTQNFRTRLLIIIGALSVGSVATSLWAKEVRADTWGNIICRLGELVRFS